MLILEKPNYPPYVCITCGVGTGRKWFVSLDLRLDNYFNPMHDGIVFQCNECWESLATEVAKKAQLYLIGMEPWDSREYVEPAYEDKSELLKEVNFNGTLSRAAIADTTEHNRSPEPSNPEPSSGDTTVDNDELDGETEPLSEFREFFGDERG